MIPYRLAMIGCGKLGGPTAELLEELGHDVRRFDIAADHGYTHAQACEGRDLILIAVPTPHDERYDGSLPISHLPPKDFSYAALEQAVTTSRTHAPDTPIVIISTVLPGTIRRLFSNRDLGTIIYNPYLISMGMVKEDLKDPDIFILGTEDGKNVAAVDILKNIYTAMYGVEISSDKWNLGTWEEAESIKIFYNTFISTKIGLVNMIQDVAERTGNMDVDVVTNALKAATKRISGPRYMTAGMGDGGPCHPRDNIALRWLADELDLGYDLFSAIMQAREQQARNLAQFLVNTAKELGQKIYIHGKSFKPDVPYCDGSYSTLIGHYVEMISGDRVSYIDPSLMDSPSSVHGVILLAHNPSITYNYNTKEGAEQYCEFLPGSRVVDPWRTFRTQDNSIKVIHYGNTRNRS